MTDILPIRRVLTSVSDKGWLQHSALLETPGGQRWRLKTDAPEIMIEASIYWGGPSVRESLQIVLSGAADPMSHGLSPPTASAGR